MIHSGLRCAFKNSIPAIKAGTESRNPKKGRIVKPKMINTNPKKRNANPIMKLDNISNRQDILSNIIKPPNY